MFGICFDSQGTTMNTLFRFFLFDARFFQSSLVVCFCFVFFFRFATTFPTKTDKILIDRTCRVCCPRETIRILHPSDEFDEKNVCFDCCVLRARARVCLLFFLIWLCRWQLTDCVRLRLAQSLFWFSKKGVFKYVCARKQSVGIIIFRLVKKSSFLKTEINSKQKYACLFVVCLFCKKYGTKRTGSKKKPRQSSNWWGKHIYSNENKTQIIIKVNTEMKSKWRVASTRKRERRRKKTKLGVSKR